MTNQVIHLESPDRYSALVMIPGWNHKAIREAKLLVVGAGALGNEVLKNLVLLGVGQVHIVDFDYIEIDNLSRSVLFTEQDVGRPKALAAAQAIRRINPDVQISYECSDVTRDLGLGIFRQYDIVMACVDNKEARMKINEKCQRVGTPWVDGGIRDFIGQATVYVPNAGACYECEFDEMDYQQLSVRYPCSQLARETIQHEKVPTTPVISSIIAAIQVQEAIKLLTHMSVYNARHYVFNGLSNTFYTIDVAKNKDCYNHTVLPGVDSASGFVSAQTTIRDLLTYARDSFFSLPHVDLAYDIIDSAVCKSCGYRDSTTIVAFRRSWESYLCPTCRTPMALNTTHKIALNDPLAEKTLQELGFPRREILALTDGAIYQYYEVSGDPWFINPLPDDLHVQSS